MSAGRRRAGTGRLGARHASRGAFLGLCLALGVSGAAMAEAWRFEAFDDRVGSPAAIVGGYPEFELTLGCFVEGADSSGQFGAPPPVLMFVATQGFARDLLRDFDTLPSFEAEIRVDGRAAGRLELLYNRRTRAFVGATAFDGPVVEALQAGRRVELRAREIDAYGAQTLTGSRRAIDRLRAACPGMTPSRRSRRDALRGAVIEIPIELGRRHGFRVVAPLRDLLN